MNYKILKDKIQIEKSEDFDIKQILDCGQIFRYQISKDCAIVHSINKQAKVVWSDKFWIMHTDDVEYFENFFDLKTDYSRIKKILMNDEFLKKAVKYGHGIRILKNDCFEMIVSFIISANNNIPRIKKSIEYLCSHFGTFMGNFYAFPTLEQLKRATEQDYVLAGLGYRASQLFETIQNLTENQLQSLKNSTKEEQEKFLLSLKGVGGKVANCIMLFGLSNMEVFPVDTWINKVYNSFYNTDTTNRKMITKDLTTRYKNLSGYAQQYAFYYFRDNNLK